jgi:hypothetical protein
MLWEPTARSLVVTEADPPLGVAVPSAVLPSRNVTTLVSPVVTVAVNVTAVPYAKGVPEVVMLTVGALVMVYAAEPTALLP